MNLFAQVNANSQAFQFGLIIGAMFAMTVCGAIPLVQGLRYNRPVAGLIGAVVTAGVAFLGGCLGGLPTAIVFAIVIYAMGKPEVDENKLQEEVNRLRDRNWQSY